MFVFYVKQFIFRNTYPNTKDVPKEKYCPFDLYTWENTVIKTVLKYKRLKLD